MIGHTKNCVVVGIANYMTAYLLQKDASTPGIGNLTFFTMPSCPICLQAHKKHLTLHLLSNSQCRSALGKQIGGPIDSNVPKVVKFTANCTLSQNKGNSLAAEVVNVGIHSQSMMNDSNCRQR